MKYIAASLLFLCALSAMAIIAGGAENRISVVVDKDYPPYSYGTDEEAGGLYTELIEEVFSRRGQKVEFWPLPWPIALKVGEEGGAAVAGIYKNQKRLEIYDYSEPIFEEHLVVYVRKGQSFPFTKLADLQGRTIGLNRGWSYGDEFDEARRKYAFTVEEAESNLQNFKKLVEGRIDCLIADRIAASQILRREKWSDQVERLEKPAAVNHAFLVFAKKLEKRRILDQFNESLAKMKRDGSYQKLIQDYVGGH